MQTNFSFFSERSLAIPTLRSRLLRSKRSGNELERRNDANGDRNSFVQTEDARDVAADSQSPFDADRAESRRSDVARLSGREHGRRDVRRFSDEKVEDGFL